MKNGKMLTAQEIEKYWGSLEAYNEEQRRIGLCEIEASQIATNFQAQMPIAANVAQSVALRSSGSQTGHRPTFGLFSHRV